MNPLLKRLATWLGLADQPSLDSTLLPTGVELQTVVYPTSESLAAGDFVNIFNNAGTPTARRVDLSTTTVGTIGGVVRVGRPLPSYLACRPELPVPEPMQCRRCSYRNQDAASRFFVRCAVNPLGPETDPCRDFQPTTEED